MRKTRTTPYHPQSDELVERFNKTLLEMLSKTVLEREHDWDLFLPSLLFAYRTSAHETTGTTPFQLMFSRDPQLPEDLLYNISTPKYRSVNEYGTMTGATLCIPTSICYHSDPKPLDNLI